MSNSLVGAVVGGTVFVYDVANGRRSGDKGRALPVVKLTKQTVYVDEGYARPTAFDINTGQQKQSAWCHLHAWLSEAEYRGETERDDSWCEFRQCIGFGSAPSHLTLEQIRALIKTVKG